MLVAMCLEQSHGDVVVGGMVQGCLTTRASCMARNDLTLTGKFMFIYSFVSSNLLRGMFKSSEIAFTTGFGSS